MGAWRVLAPELSIVKVYYGDANKDGYNDVLFQMSDGASLVFYSKKLKKKAAAPKDAPKKPGIIFEDAPQKAKPGIIF